MNPRVVALWWARVEKGPDCWTWTGYRIKRYGYGELVWHEDGKRFRSLAHRLGYEILVGPIPEGLVIDHLCRNPPCVNPDHLEPVTIGENVRRGTRHPVGRCHRGHEWNAQTEYRAPGGGRRCRPCHAEYERNRQRKLRAS